MITVLLILGIFWVLYRVNRRLLGRDLEDSCQCFYCIEQREQEGQVIQ